MADGDPSLALDVVRDVLVALSDPALDVVVGVGKAPGSPERRVYLYPGRLTPADEDQAFAEFDLQFGVTLISRLAASSGDAHAFTALLTDWLAVWRVLAESPLLTPAGGRGVIDCRVGTAWFEFDRSDPGRPCAVGAEWTLRFKVTKT